MVNNSPWAWEENKQVKEMICLLPELLNHLGRISAERDGMECHLFAMKNHPLVKSVICDNMCHSVIGNGLRN